MIIRLCVIIIYSLLTVSNGLPFVNGYFKIYKLADIMEFE